MIDDIVLSESAPLASGRADTAIALPRLAAALTDRDGSETLRLTIAGIPAGARLSDGEHHFRATGGNRVADVSGWDLARLSLRPPRQFSGTLHLEFIATAREQDNGSEATSRAPVELRVRPARCLPLACPAGFAFTLCARLRLDLRQLTADRDGESLALGVGDPAPGGLNDGAGSGWWTGLAGPRFRSDESFRHMVADGDAAVAATIRLRIVPITAAAPPPQTAQSCSAFQPEADAHVRPARSLPGKPASAIGTGTAHGGLAARRMPTATATGDTGMPRADMLAQVDARTLLAEGHGQTRAANRPPAAPTTADMQAGNGSPGASPASQPAAVSAAVAPRIDWSRSPAACFSAPQRAVAAWLPAFLGAAQSASAALQPGAPTIRIDA